VERSYDNEEKIQWEHNSHIESKIKKFQSSISINKILKGKIKIIKKSNMNPLKIACKICNLIMILK